MQARRIEQLLGQAERCSLSCFLRACTVCVSLQIPIAALLKFAILPDGAMPRLQRLNAVNRSPRRWNMTELQKRAYSMRCDARRNNSGREEGLNFRRKNNSISRQRVVERFNPEPVARKEQPIFRRVPDRECEHAA